jgi:hypothetical protein
VKTFTSASAYLFCAYWPVGVRLLEGKDVATFWPYIIAVMRYAVLGMLLLFALGDGCSPPPNIVGVQDFGHVTGRVLDAMTNRPIPNALLSVGSLYTTRADVRGAFTLRAVTGDQTVTARAPGYTTATADTTITKDTVVSIGYIRLVPLVHPEGQPTLAPPPTPSPRVSPTPAVSPSPATGASPAGTASPAAAGTPATVASPHAGVSPLATPTTAPPSPAST